MSANRTGAPWQYPAPPLSAAGPSPRRGVRGELVDQGVILYEMLSGRQAFGGESVGEMMSAILRDEPAELREPSGKIPPQLERIVRRCLEKKPEQRFQSASDLGFALEALSAATLTPSGSRQQDYVLLETATALPAVIESLPLTGKARLFGNERLAWMVAAFFLLVSLASLPFTIAHLGSTKPDARPIVRYDIQAPAKTALNLIRSPAIALSPDGSTMALVASSDGINRLYVRKRDEAGLRLLAGTEGASDSVFSPDGKWLAFFADFTLKKVPLDGPVISLIKITTDPRGLSWAGNDTLIYAPGIAAGLFQISANGGVPKPVSEVDAKKDERTHRWPQVLPGGKAVIFTVGALNSPDNYDRANIEAVVLSTGERRVILEGASMARYAPTGHLIFAREGVLYAVGFDADRLMTRGAPVSILQGVAGDQTTGAAHFAMAEDGTLAYIPGGTGANLRHLVWADRSGKLQPVNLPGAQYNDLRISPDGSRVALIIGSSGNGDVWVYDFGRATFTRLTFNTTNASPVWSPDGKSIFYTAIDPSGNKTTVFRKPADGSREAEAVTSLGRSAYMKWIEPNGAWAVLDYEVNINKGDIIRLLLEPEAKMSPLVNTPFQELGAALSADGRWLAYQSNDNGPPEIYVRDLSGSGGRFQISTAGGEEPRWSPDGRELYYRNNDLFMSVAVETRAAFQQGTPKNLFNAIYNLRSNSGVSYDVDPKSGRFLMIRPAEDEIAPAQVRMVLNWFEELRRLAQAR